MFKDTQAFSSFSVDDVGTARKFYGDTLGLKTSEDEMGNLVLELAGGGRVFVYGKGPQHQPASFTVLNFPVDEIEKTVPALKERGITFEQYDAPEIKTDPDGISRGTPKIAWFKDPAGNTLSVVQ